MNIGISAHNSKKVLMQDFCIAYKKLFERHRIIATGNTGRKIEEVTRLPVVKLLPGSLGGEQQFIAQIEHKELDAVIIFYQPDQCDGSEVNVEEITRLCDLHNIPIATNIGTAEVLVLSIL
jgi:methylglyoxal synthase